MIVRYRSPDTGETYVMATGTVYTNNRHVPYNETIMKSGTPKITFILHYDYVPNNDPNERRKYTFFSLTCALYGTGYGSTNYTLAKEMLTKGTKVLVTGKMHSYAKTDADGNPITVDELWADAIIPIEAVSAMILRDESKISDYYIKKSEMRKESRLMAKQSKEKQYIEEEPDDDYDFD